MIRPDDGYDPKEYTFYRQDQSDGPRSPIIVLLVALGLGVCLIASLLLAWPAHAHDAPPSKEQPLGWTYGWECCNLMDCFQEDTSNVEELPEGYRVISTGEVIGYADKRLKKSKDEFFHRCSHGGKKDDPKSICLYVPNKGF